MLACVRSSEEDGPRGAIDDGQSVGVADRADCISHGFPVGMAFRGSAFELIVSIDPSITVVRLPVWPGNSRDFSVAALDAAG
jgi:hypothetical protein